MKLYDEIPVWGDPVDEGAVAQMKTCAKDAVRAALMADHHVGYSMPIGGVAAYKDAISPSGVGYDIACGNKAIRLDLDGRRISHKMKTIMDDVARIISFGIGRSNAEEVDHPLFDDPTWSIDWIAPIKDKARAQLGTVGSGNHYVDIFADEEDKVWIGVHFGSRGLGHTIASHAIRAGGGSDGMFVEPVLLPVGTASADDYLAGMNLAGRYAYAGRDWVCERVRQILGAEQIDEVHNHHNFAWHENHGGEDVYVVRKGATPAFPGQRGFVGGSMGDISVILEGVEHEEAAQSLYSTVHGAGRIMSRTKAAGKLKKGRRQGGAITPEMMMEWVKKKGVELRGGGTDESPQVYKRLPSVLDQHYGTIRILHRLKPLGVAMAGEGEFDPYKD